MENLFDQTFIVDRRRRLRRRRLRLELDRHTKKWTEEDDEKATNQDHGM